MSATRIIEEISSIPMLSWFPSSSLKIRNSDTIPPTANPNAQPVVG